MLEIFIARVGYIIDQICTDVCKKNLLNALAISSVFFVSSFMLTDSGKNFLLFFSRDNFIYSFLCVSDVRFVFS